jgi:murein DD-endopeptidase MepM/ murein hydrolase activator NlpD
MGAGAYSVNLRDQNTGITNSTLAPGTSLPQTIVAGHAYRWSVASCASATGGNNTTNCPNRSSTWAFGVQGTTTAWLWPVKGEDTRNVVSQPYADYDDGKKDYYHTALDIAVPNNTEIVSAAPGTVARLIFNESSTDCQIHNGGSGCPDHGDGNTIVIQNTPNAVYSQYQHLADFDATLQGQVTSTCAQNANNPLEYDCYNTGPMVTAGQTIGHSGGSGYGSANFWPYHLHFEVKDFSTIAPPGIKEWGYTSVFPDFDGYFDPMIYVDSTMSITPIRVTITPAGNGVTLRIGPRQNYPAPPFKPGYGYNNKDTVYWARQTAPASPGCSGGWYQIYQGPPEDSQYPPNTFTNYFHETFNENGKVFGMLPSVWVCRGDSGVVWVSP